VAERIVESLKFEIELLRLGFFALLGIGGGTVGLVLGEWSLVRLSFAVGGFLLMNGLWLWLWRQRRAIRATIATIQE
jgi:hypothetical protein